LELLSSKHNDSGRIRDDVRNDFFDCDYLGRLHDCCHTCLADRESRFDGNVHGDDYASERPSIVNLSVKGLPSGTSGTFIPSSVTSSSNGTTSALRVTVSSSATSGHDVYGAREQR